MSGISPTKQVSTAYWNTLTTDEKITKIKEGYTPYTTPQYTPSTQSSYWDVLSTDEKLQRLKLGLEPTSPYISSQPYTSLYRTSLYPQNTLHSGTSYPYTYSNTSYWNSLTSDEKLMKIKNGTQPYSIPHYTSLHYPYTYPYLINPYLHSTSIEIEKSQLYRIENIKNERAGQLKNIDELKSELEKEKEKKIVTEKEFEESVMNTTMDKEREVYEVEQQIKDKINELENEKLRLIGEKENQVKTINLNKSFTMGSSDNKIEELEKNLELAQLNKRRNSLDLESAITTHQCSPFKQSYMYTPYQSYNSELNNAVAKSRADDIKKRLDMDQSLKSPLKTSSFLQSDDKQTSVVN